MKKTAVSLLLLLFVLTAMAGIETDSNAQGKNEINDSLYSQILQEYRTVNIILPESYEPGSADKYEVIYLTDGEWVNNLFPFIYKFALDENYVPPVIIVVIPNRYINGVNQRDRDFLPVNVPQPAISGGADKFLAFLKSELIPWIDEKFPNNGTNSLYGHSYGGVFVMYALLSEPQLFQTYYATDPPYSWNNGYMIGMASDKLGDLPDDRILWIGGIESTYRQMGIERMDSILRVHAPDRFSWKLATYPNEKHNSVRLKAMYDGIKYAYSGFSGEPFMFHPMNGILLKDKPVTLFIESSAELRYTTDGTEPDESSPLAESIIQLDGPAQVAVKFFSATGKYDKTTKGRFEHGEAPSPVSKPADVTSGGLRYSFYEGKWEKLPEFSSLNPAGSGIAGDEFDLNGLGHNGFGCLFEGFVEVETDGYHIFAVVSDDESRLFINDQLIIDNNDARGSENIKSFVLPLKRGFYPLRLEYLHRKGDKVLQFLWLPPEGQNPGPVPSRLLYNTP